VCSKAQLLLQRFACYGMWVQNEAQTVPQEVTSVLYGPSRLWPVAVPSMSECTAVMTSDNCQNEKEKRTQRRSSFRPSLPMPRNAEKKFMLVSIATPS
jgi:hypothetical protein